jgi:hydrogenase nickel incorporation protein HypB
MCNICGCSHSGHEGHRATDHTHNHGHSFHQSHDHHITPGVIDLVRVEKDIISRNDRFARENRERLARAGVCAVNLVSSPGSGKTTLLVKTIERLKSKIAVAVVEGDQQTSIDADRIKATGAPAFQINTGRACHLDAHMVGHALDELPLRRGSILFIENVGNLVCPAGFDLGETQNVTLLSVTEGEDKPLKYPVAFAAAGTVLLSKIDLFPHLDFEVDRCLGNVRAINPDICIFQVSAKTGEGMEDWLSWLEQSANLAMTRPILEVPSYA